MTVSDNVNVTAMPALRRIPFDGRHVVQALLLSGLVYGFFLCLAMLFARNGVADSICLALIHLGGAFALFTCWKLGRWGYARFDCFGAGLLLLGMAFRLHAFIDALSYGTRIEEIYRYPSVPMPDSVIALLLKGEIITVSGLLLVACSWRFGVGSRVEQFSFLGSARQVPIKLALLVYGMALMSGIGRKVLDIGFGPFEQILGLLYNFGIAAIYFIAARKGAVVRQVAIAGVFALPMSALALSSGMKEMILFPFMPAAILYWMGFKSITARGAAALLGISLLALSQLYVHHVRQTTWRSAGNLDVSTGELISGFGRSVDAAQSTDALDSINARINLTIAHAITVTLADHRGHEPVEVFGLIPASVIPRILWPGKPVMQPGAMHTARILGGNMAISQISSATAAGFWAELYLGGWWWGVVLGSIVYGVLLATAQKWALGFAPGFGHNAFCFLAMYSTLRFDEKHVVYAFTGVFFTAIFVSILACASGLFRSKLEGSRASSHVSS